MCEEGRESGGLDFVIAATLIHLFLFHRSAELMCCSGWGPLGDECLTRTYTLAPGTFIYTLALIYPGTFIYTLVIHIYPGTFIYTLVPSCIPWCLHIYPGPWYIPWYLHIYPGPNIAWYLHIYPGTSIYTLAPSYIPWP